MAINILSQLLEFPLNVIHINFFQDTYFSCIHKNKYIITEVRKTRKYDFILFLGIIDKEILLRINFNFEKHCQCNIAYYLFNMFLISNI